MRKKLSLFFFAICFSILALPSLVQAHKFDSTTQFTAIDTTIKNVQAEKIFETAEIEASVDDQLWRRQLETYLLAPIEKAAKKGMKAGQYTINIRFLVEHDGYISEVKALNDPGYGLAEACVKVIKTGPRWTPGEVNGRKVRSYHTQPITFVIQEK